MQKLKEILQGKTQKADEVYDVVCDMVCSGEDYIALPPESIEAALKLDGEFLLLYLQKEEIEEELQTQQLKYPISESLSIVSMFESDGSNFEQIEAFVALMKSYVDPLQNFVFGVKKVDKLSKTPLKILFSGILPINQLQLSIGSKLYEYIHSDEEYFKAEFLSFRRQLSKALGIPILPVYSLKDEHLAEMEIELKDHKADKTLAKFALDGEPSKELIQEYLKRVFAIYCKLAM